VDKIFRRHPFYTQSLYLDTTVNGTGPTTYILTVNNSNNCIDADTINVWFVTCESVDEFNDSEIKVFPNPTSENVYIKIPTQNTTKIELFNIYGALLISTDVTDAINISYLPQGIYVIKINFYNTYVMRKIAKNNL